MRALIAAALLLALAGSAQAAGWDWFVKHRPSPGGGAWIASKYCDGKRTASGEMLNCSAHTAAHNSLPFGTMVTVCNARQPGRCVTVKINDRGPKIAGRMRRDAIDMTPAAFRQLGALGPGGRVESGWVYPRNM